MFELYNKMIGAIADKMNIKLYSERIEFRFIIGTMFFIVFLFILVFIAAHTRAAETSKTESEYVIENCNENPLNGDIEYVLEDQTRVDCLTHNEAIEFDYNYKWYECITQSLHYARMTEKSAACALIIESDSDIEYERVERAKSLVKNYALPIRIFTVD